MENKPETLENIEAAPEAAAQPRPTINWGGVVKGAAIVAAVVVAGVVGFWAVHAAATALLAIPQVSVAAQAVASATAPVAHFATGIVTYLTGFVPHIPGMIGAFFSHAFGIHGASMAAGHALSASSSAVVANSMGGLGAGAVMAGGAAIAAPHLAHLNILHPGVAHPVPGDTGSGTLSPEAHDAGTEMATTTLKTSHVAAENSHEHRVAERAALYRAQADKSWVDRTGTAGRASNSFADQLSADRAKLDATLGEPAR